VCSSDLGLPARIILKLNSLAERKVIEALLEAAEAGVKVDLIVRGICCLRPGVPGTSDNIRVISVVDRFLEHARIFYFENGGKREVYLSSADWMPRNFLRRVEVMFPVEDEGLRDRVVDEILATTLADNVKARRLLADGTYVRTRHDPGTASPAGNGVAALRPLLRSQTRFMELAREKAQSPAVPGGGNGGYQVRATPLSARTSAGGALPAAVALTPAGDGSSLSSVPPQPVVPKSGGSSG